MTEYYSIHKDNPQQRLLKLVKDGLINDSIVVIPTDTSYIICSKIGDKAVEKKLINIKQNEDNHRLAILVKDLSMASNYAKISNWAYKLMRKYTPGPFTFILPASKEVPKRLLNKRNTIGIRIPDNNILLNLLDLYNEPLYSTTLWLENAEFPVFDVSQIPDNIAKLFDIIVDGGECVPVTSTVVSLLDDNLEILRPGLGEI